MAPSRDELFKSWVQVMAKKIDEFRIEKSQSN